jgi:hypothetical protein
MKVNYHAKRTKNHLGIDKANSWSSLYSTSYISLSWPVLSSDSDFHFAEIALFSRFYAKFARGGESLCQTAKL